MSHAILVIPTHQGTGLTSSILGLFHSFQRKGVNVSYYKPVSQIDGEHRLSDHAHSILQNFCQDSLNRPISAKQADELLSVGRTDELLEKIIINYEKYSQDKQIVLIGGLLESKHQPYAAELNSLIAKALSADVVLSSDAINVTLQQFEHKLEYAAEPYGGTQSKTVLGVIINRINTENSLSTQQIAQSKLFTTNFKNLACIPILESLTYPRTSDVADFLQAAWVFEGEASSRRIANYSLVARTIPNAVSFLTPGYLVVTPSDRDDVIMATTLSASSGNKIAGLLLTGETEITKQVLDLCMPLIKNAGLPVMQVKTGSWKTVSQMDNFNLHTPVNDSERIQKTMEHFADYFDNDWHQQYLDSEKEIKLSPAAFKYLISKRAKSQLKTIVLPEGDEPRTVVAANICAKRKLANCVLLAPLENVQQVAQQQGIVLDPSLTIINPNSIRQHYEARLIELRKHKGMNEVLAKTQLEDNVMLGTMMLEAKEVDGLVSGAIHTTANTIRPPLQIIKTAKESKLVSSIFFMCLAEQVLVYGDCAINPNPNADELSEIAIQSAGSAQAFGISPRVAMISYSTGASGSGDDVKKVREATQLVRQKRPDIIIDGPLQYDAAAIQSVAKQKAPNSEVAGQANVFIFPDLNTGNTTYKAVQRSANAISIGPMLQGMRMPVNDLSRGAPIEDIVYTIAITAIQAQ